MFLVKIEIDFGYPVRASSEREFDTFFFLLDFLEWIFPEKFTFVIHIMCAADYTNYMYLDIFIKKFFLIFSVRGSRVELFYLEN